MKNFVTFQIMSFFTLPMEVNMICYISNMRGKIMLENSIETNYCFSRKSEKFIAVDKTGLFKEGLHL